MTGDWVAPVKADNLPADRGGELDFSTLLSIMHQQLQQEAPQEEILGALRMVDREQKGFILASELRAKLVGLGERLTDQEGERTSMLVFISAPFRRDEKWSKNFMDADVRGSFWSSGLLSGLSSLPSASKIFFPGLHFKPVNMC